MAFPVSGIRLTTFFCSERFKVRDLLDPRLISSMYSVVITIKTYLRLYK